MSIVWIIDHQLQMILNVLIRITQYLYDPMVVYMLMIQIPICILICILIHLSYLDWRLLRILVWEDDAPTSV